MLAGHLERGEKGGDESPALAVPASARVRIIGIDPGSRITGFGVIDAERNHCVHVHSGVVTPRTGHLAERLHAIHAGILDVIDEFAPHELAIERVFMHRNADSALKLGQARAAALLAGAVRGLPVFEYAPNAIKQSVTGRGHAEKRQIQHMMRVLLCLSDEPLSDQADALAVALTHGHTRQTLSRVKAAGATP